MYIFNPCLTSLSLAAKKNPRQDFAHLTLSNTVPVLEGEVGLYRTGSDGCLPEALERAGVSQRNCTVYCCGV